LLVVDAGGEVERVGINVGAAGPETKGPKIIIDYGLSTSAVQGAKIGTGNWIVS